MKNYVKEFKGYKVPEGATHYNSESISYVEGFYKYDNNKVIFAPAETLEWLIEDNPQWIPINAIELPEAPQEWMPEVGEECEVLDTCYAHPKHSEVKVKGFYNKQVWLTLPSGEDRVVLIANCKFRPLKTQQEKDREAFVELGMSKFGTFRSNRDFLAALFDDGARFTELKAGE